jgi:hypothetical protein
MRERAAIKEQSEQDDGQPRSKSYRPNPQLPDRFIHDSMIGPEAARGTIVGWNPAGKSCPLARLAGPVLSAAACLSRASPALSIFAFHQNLAAHCTHSTTQQLSDRHSAPPPPKNPLSRPRTIFMNPFLPIHQQFHQLFRQHG